MDPDPHSFSLLDPDPDPGEKYFQKKQKKCKEIGNNCKFVKILSKVNLHKLYCFLLMSILKKALHKVILNTFFTAGSGSVLLDPDSQI